MLAIGRALMAAPRLLLLDEPSLGLAPRLVEQVRDTIVELNRQGASVLLVEQNAAMALADREPRLRDGDRSRGQGRPGGRPAGRPGHPGVLPRRRRDGPALVPGREVVPAAEAMERRVRAARRDSPRRRPSSVCGSAASPRSTASRSTSGRASCSRSSVPTAPARRRSSTCSTASTARSTGSITLDGEDAGRALAAGDRPPRRRRARSRTSACSRTCRSSTTSCSAATT